jgi:hypothetical protein
MATCVHRIHPRPVGCNAVAGNALRGASRLLYRRQHHPIGCCSPGPCRTVSGAQRPSRTRMNIQETTDDLFQ